MLFVGMLSGTYSSIFIATPVLARPQGAGAASTGDSGRVKVNRRLAGGRGGGSGPRPSRVGGATAAPRRRRPGRRPDAVAQAQRRPAGRDPGRTTRPLTAGAGGVPARPPGRPPRPVTRQQPRGPAAPSGRPGARQEERGSAPCRTSRPLIAAHVRDVPTTRSLACCSRTSRRCSATPTRSATSSRRRAARHYGPADKVVGIEARGFILAAPVAYEIRAGFVPVRKKGKLPSATFAQEYDLEYGSAVPRGPPGRLPAGRPGADRRRRARHRRHRPGHRVPDPAGGRTGRRHRRADGTVLPEGPRRSPTWRSGPCSSV